MLGLQEKYKKEVVPVLMKDLKLSNVMEVPSVEKVVVNAGIGSFRDKKEAVASFVEELAQLTGQRPSERKARLSESGFKIRAGDVVGYAVTLRGSRMWAFLDKFINIVLPRVRDFRGLSRKAFDNSGNYSVGIVEHTIFPEVNPNTTKGVRNLQVTVVTDAKDKEESEKLLSLLGLPLKK
jgi:large subunit ribosomal protein L5